MNHVTSWLVLSTLLSKVAADSSTFYTENGYDNIHGIHSVCWVAMALPPNTTEHTDPFASDIATSSSLLSSPPVQLRSCPEGNEVTVAPPGGADRELYFEDEILRTNTPYQFRLTAEIDLATIRTELSVTENAMLFPEAEIAGRIAFCPPSGRFCSPYVPARAMHFLETYHQHELQSDGEATEETIKDQNKLQQTLGSVDTQNLERITALANATTAWQIQNLSAPQDDVLLLEYWFEVTMTKQGQYLPLGVIQILFRDSGKIFRIDIANLLYLKEVFFEDPPVIRSVQEYVEVVSYVGIAAVGSIQVWLLFCAIRHRNESVMKMSQGSFLIMLQVAGLIATCSSVLLQPKNETYCRLGVPMTLLPIQFMLAVIFGRLLRIVSIMGDLMDWHKTKDKANGRMRADDRTDIRARLTRLSATFRKSMIPQNDEEEQDEVPNSKGAVQRSLANNTVHNGVQNGRKIRHNFTVTWLWITIAAIMFPQVVMQTIRLTVFDVGRGTSVNEEQSLGRYDCGSEGEHLFSIGSTAISIFTLFATLFQAHKSRKLPALFNEAASVSTALLSTLLITVLGITIVTASKSPTSSPDVSYLMLVSVVLTTSLSISLRLVIPKLRLVWRGEKVVITRIMREHRNRQQQKQAKLRIMEMAGRSFAVLIGRQSSQESVRGNGAFSLGQSFRFPTRARKSFIEDNAAPFRNSSNLGRSRTTNRSMNASVDQKPPPIITLEELRSKSSEAKESFAKSTAENDMGGSWSLDVERINNDDNSLHLEDIPAPLAAANDEDYAYVIEEGQAPPSDVTVNIVHLSQCINNINNRILSGLHVEETDWRELQGNIEESKLLLERLQFR